MSSPPHSPSPSDLSPPPLLFYPPIVSFVVASPHPPVVFTPWRICKAMTHCPSLHQLCQQLFNDGSKSQAKVGQQLTGCLCAHAVKLERVLIFTYKAAYTFEF